MENTDCLAGIALCGHGAAMATLFSAVEKLFRYGDDCTRLRKGAEATAARTAPWIRRHARSPLLEHSLTGAPATRRRPLIYVYDMDTLFTSKMLQWRHVKEACLSRFYARCAHSPA